MESIILKGNVICRDSILENTLVIIRDGIIESIQKNSCIKEPIIDFGNSYIIPGLIDIHCDVIEKDVEIRKRVYVPDEQALHYADMRYASAGITTMYHGISFGHHSRGLRNDNRAERLARIIFSGKKHTCIDNRILLRLEIVNPSSAYVIEKLIERNIGDMVSFMDHSPKTKHFTDLERYLVSKEIIQPYEEYIPLDNFSQSYAEQTYLRLKRLSEIAHHKGIPLGSHDDKTLQRLDTIAHFGVIFCEFPETGKLAAEATKRGMYPIVGAPNAHRGASHLNWLSAREAIKQNQANILCSDYHPTILPAAMFSLAENKCCTLPEAIRTASFNPANALGLHDRGEIARGKRADLAVVVMNDTLPVVTATWCKGTLVFARKEALTCLS